VAALARIEPVTLDTMLTVEPTRMHQETPGARMTPAVELRGFGVSFGDRIILSNLDLSLPKVGLVVLMGPAGGGKSTLLRTLAGLNDAHAAMKTWGELVINGQPLALEQHRHVAGGQRRPLLVTQHARFYLDTVRQNLVSGLPNRAQCDHATQSQIVRAALGENGLSELAACLEQEAVSLSLGQQRCLAIVRALLSEPEVVFVDEPTTGLNDAEATALLDLLKGQAGRRCIVYVTHNQRWAQAAGGTSVLLASGHVKESGPTERFFKAPATELGRQFVATGSCPTSAPKPPSRPSRAVASAPAQHGAPRGFIWLKAGQLGGLPRPGIVDELDDDLAGLCALKVTVLVTLEERPTLDANVLAGLGIESVHFPIVDMDVPSVTDAVALCERVTAWVAGGRIVAVHCLAGHGRTGTVLACQLIFEGASAPSALESVRVINTRLVQSDAQVAFLGEFERAIARLRPPRREATQSIVNEPTEMTKGNK
jgi:atypical dual specificity phosphatase